MKLILVGEAYGAEEARWSMPFVGPAGQELNRLLEDAGIKREECFVTNVFNFQPKGNDISTLCCKRPDAGIFKGWPALARGVYLRDEYAKEVERLRIELIRETPNCCVALGGTAAWALLRSNSISKIRGTLHDSTLVPGLKVLPTFHPAILLPHRGQYHERPTILLDLIKAKRESEYPEIRRVPRTIWLEPTIADLEHFLHSYIVSSPLLSFDIETAGGQITCIGFAPRTDLAIVVPFVDLRKGGSYWNSVQEELAAWRWVERVLALPMPKLGQNGKYDWIWLWKKYRIKVVNYAEDTMLLHHALQPESEKGLGFLGSIYCEEPAWKEIHFRGNKTEKEDN